MKRVLLFLVLLSCCGLSFAGARENCFTVLAGKLATADGAVLCAHNEDDPWPQVVNWYKVPRKQHQPDEVVTLKNGGTLPQVRETNAYVWFQIPGEQFACSYMNEFGVTIVSNACASKERKPALTDGGIGWWLRRLMAERARTAREAVELAGRLVDRFGYIGSGRTYSIADGNEAWMMAVVNGKHWVACRIPDDRVAVIANRYTIDAVNLDDAANCIGSPDLVAYAIQQGWYDPALDGPFVFHQVYGDPESEFGIRNIGRQWRGINRLKEEPVQLRKPMPFTFSPRKKLTLRDLFDELRDHFEGTELEGNPAWNKGNPHDFHIKRICSQTNMYGIVAHLRADLPTEIGSVLWVAMRRPCVQPFVPVFAGVTGFPTEFSQVPEPEAQPTQFSAADRYRRTGNLAWWLVVDRSDAIDRDYSALAPGARRQAIEIENTFLEAVPGFQKKAADAWNSNPDHVRETMTGFSALALGQLVQLNR